MITPRRRLLAGLAGLTTLLAGLMLLRQVWIAPLGIVEETGTLSWRMTGEPAFGGFSGLELSDDGRDLTAISDRSVLFTGTIRRDGDRIDGIEAAAAHLMVSDVGNRLDGRDGIDLEGLARYPDGRLALSNEGYGSLYRIDRIGPDPVPVEGIPLTGPYTALTPNLGLEALALDGEDRLIGLPEDPGAVRDGAIPVYRQDGDRFDTAFTIPQSGSYRPVGADTGPDGWLYVLERRLVIPLGISSQIRRFAPGAQEGELLLRSRLGRYGNLEGLSVWRDTAGRIRLTAISDDDFLCPLRCTRIVEFAVPAANP